MIARPRGFLLCAGRPFVGAGDEAGKNARSTDYLTLSIARVFSLDPLVRKEWSISLTGRWLIFCGEFFPPFAESKSEERDKFPPGRGFWPAIT